MVSSASPDYETVVAASTGPHGRVGDWDKHGTARAAFGRDWDRATEAMPKQDAR